VPDVRIAEKRIWVGDQSRALLHGEVHYWRLSPSRWREILRSVREVGMDVISSYVCWDFHEVSPDTFDFRGETDPQRNLVSFIELAAAEGFWLGGAPGEAVLGALYAADVDYECCDMETGRIEKRLLFYGGSDRLSRSAQNGC
jgi:beta-galactosidase